MKQDSFHRTVVPVGIIEHLNEQEMDMEYITEMSGSAVSGSQDRTASVASTENDDVVADDIDNIKFIYGMQ